MSLRGLRDAVTARLFHEPNDAWNTGSGTTDAYEVEIIASSYVDMSSLAAPAFRAASQCGEATYGSSKGAIRRPEDSSRISPEMLKQCGGSTSSDFIESQLWAPTIAEILILLAAEVSLYGPRYLWIDHRAQVLVAFRGDETSDLEKRLNDQSGQDILSSNLWSPLECDPLDQTKEESLKDLAVRLQTTSNQTNRRVHAQAPNGLPLFAFPEASFDYLRGIPTIQEQIERNERQASEIKTKALEADIKLETIGPRRRQ